jgi:hypothetical protein
MSTYFCKYLQNIAKVLLGDLGKREVAVFLYVIIRQIGE